MKYLLILTSLLTLTSCMDMSEPKGLGLSVQKLGKISGFALKPCEKGNCVVSFKENSPEKQFIEPIKYIESKEKSYEKVMALVLKDKSLNVIETKNNYIRAKQILFGKIISDIEFYFGINKYVHMRMEMRGVPHDLGNGRRLLEKLRFKYQQNDY